MNTNKLRGKIVECGLSVSELALRVGLDRATLYRKIKKQEFSVSEAVLISRELNLSKDEVMAIFFTSFVA
ncbi:helix-turn-helix domain-containing protein [Paenibacillus senegalimassiliensis]|uniref:helix-turn-helix domain-containing protein n=1 Tax=Paenibacillus senegalimassiliensis TaxID=1737426 RepID=UPI0009EC60BB|nr:helix-turn-helix domain-containing protein [Paenibacillus senegalimassiliensis]